MQINYQIEKKRLPTAFKNKSRNVKERKYIIRPRNIRTKKVQLTKHFNEFSDDSSSDESSKNFKVQRRPVIFKNIARYPESLGHRGYDIEMDNL